MFYKMDSLEEFKTEVVPIQHLQKEGNLSLYLWHGQIWGIILFA